MKRYLKTIMDTKELQKLIAIWFEEDIRDGDHTSLSCIPETEMQLRDV